MSIAKGTIILVGLRNSGHKAVIDESLKSMLY